MNVHVEHFNLLAGRTGGEKRKIKASRGGERERNTGKHKNQLNVGLGEIKSFRFPRSSHQARSPFCIQPTEKRSEREQTNSFRPLFDVVVVEHGN
jgi:hypothetical protein